MAEYDRWNWTCSRNNQGWGSNSNIMKPQFDTQLQDQLAALNEVFVQGIEIMRQIQEESFANVQRMVEESTHRVMKEIVFDDDYGLNDFNNQDLEDDSSCKNLSWEYEPFEKEVQGSLEVKEAYEAIDSSSSIELTNTPITDSYVPFQHSSSSYILYKLEPRKKFLYQHYHFKTSLVDFMCQTFPYRVKHKDFNNQDLYAVMHDIYYERNPLFDKALSQ